MSFDFKRLEIPEVVLITPKVFADERGFFLQNYQYSVFEQNGIKTRFVQDNLSHSVKGVLRGLHYQKNPAAQAKLVSVIKGEIFDVAVDMRKDSPTYGKWVGEYLSSENKKSLYIPEGFAHGFCVLSDEVYFTYKVSAEYAPKEDRGVLWNDKDIAIKWPKEIENPILSEKDLKQPTFAEADNNF